MSIKAVIKELLEDFNVGDMIYNVRESTDMSDFDGDSWDHPRVKRFSDLVSELEEYVK